MKTHITLLKIVKAAADTALKKDANCTTCLAVFQPNVPEKLNQFKRKKNDQQNQ